MKPELQRTCPCCGNEFSGALEFCPVCMLRKGPAAGVEPGASTLSDDTDIDGNIEKADTNWRQLSEP